MKYFGTYNNNSDLVPKSYVDSAISSYINSNIGSYINNILYSHSEYSFNAAYRLIKDKTPKEGAEQFFLNWDDYTSSSYAEFLVDTEYRFSSISFVYDRTDERLPYFEDPDLSGYPAAPNNVLDPTDNPLYPDPSGNPNAIYYKLGLEQPLRPGHDLFVFMTTDPDFTIDHYRIRILIPNYLIDENNGITYGVFYNGKYISGSGQYTTNGGYIDIGRYVDSGNHSNDYFLSATLHIYFDGTNYYIDRLPYSDPPVDNTIHST